MGSVCFKLVITIKSTQMIKIFYNKLSIICCVYFTVNNIKKTFAQMRSAQMIDPVQYHNSQYCKAFEVVGEHTSLTLIQYLQCNQIQ